MRAQVLGQADLGSNVTSCTHQLLDIAAIVNLLVSLIYLELQP